MSGRKSFLALAAAPLFLLGCASRGIVGPAGVVSHDVAIFQGNLTTFQEQVSDYRAAEADRTAGDQERTIDALNATKRLQVEWSLVEAKGVSDAFSILQDQGQTQASVALKSAIAPVAPAKVSLPIDKLASVVSMTDKLATRPNSQKELRFLVGYGAKVNSAIGKIQTSTSAPSPAPAAKSPAAQPATPAS